MPKRLKGLLPAANGSRMQGHDETQATFRGGKRSNQGKSIKKQKNEAGSAQNEHCKRGSTESVCNCFSLVRWIKDGKKELGATKVNACCKKPNPRPDFNINPSN